MTFAGSILYLGYLLWIKLCGRFINQRMRYGALLIVLLVHLIPLTRLKGLYDNAFRHIPYLGMVGRTWSPVSMAEIDTATEAYFTSNYVVSLIMAFTWVLVGSLILINKCISYFQLRKKLRKLCWKCDSERVIGIIERLRKEFHVRQKVNVVQIRGDRNTFTIGVFKPLIILQETCPDPDLELILRHEMIHIARKDLVFKFLLEVLRCLYWFNPFTYFLSSSFEKVCEASCDEIAVRKLTKEECATYAKIVVKNTKRGSVISLGKALSDNRRNVEERVKVIMNKRKIKCWERLVAVGVFVVFMMVDSLAALAYPNVYQVNNAEVNTAEKAIVGENTWMTVDVSEADEDLPEFDVLYDKEFVSLDGDIAEVNDYAPIKFCFKHKWEDGYFQTHLKNSSGGCTTDVYKGQRCIWCNTINLEGLYATHTYTTCPH